MLHRNSCSASARKIGVFFCVELLELRRFFSTNIFVANLGDATIGEYSTTGTVVNAALAQVPLNPRDVAVSGSDLFVASQGGTVSEYTTSGDLVNASLISGLNQPLGIAVSGTDIFVEYGTGDCSVGEYDMSGTVVNATLVTGLNEADAVRISGSDLFVVNEAGGVANAGSIGEYTTAGAVINASLVSGLTEPVDVAVAGSDLFVTLITSDTVAEYTTSGVTVNAALITGVDSPYGIAVSGSDLFVAGGGGNQGSNTIGEYSTTGAVVNATLVTGVDGLAGLTVADVADNILAFAQQPIATTANTMLAPLTVDVQSPAGILLANDQSDVSIALTGGTGGATLAGTITVAAVNGVATFSDLSIATPGTYSLTATDGTDTPATSTPFNIADVQPMPAETIGGLDPTYGTDGVASHNVGFASTNGIAEDGSQSVLIGTIGTAPSESLGITRYNSDGSLDTAFGSGGVVSTRFGGTDDVPSAVDVLGNGDILVAGTATTYTTGVASGSDFAVAEYNPDGSLNPGFGGGTGEALVSFSATAGTLTNDVLAAMAVSTGGTIYLGGSTGSDFAIAALNAVGTAAAFGSGGEVTQSFGGGAAVINSLALQSNGDIVAAGSASIGGVTQIALARFLPGGLLDKRFGVKGLVITNVRGVYDSASSDVIQKTGQIVIGGISATGSGAFLSSDFVVARYTAAGRIDKSFVGGPVITSFGEPSAVTQLVLQTNGEVVASGKITTSLSSVTPDQLNIAVARYTIRGVLDTTFNGTGKTVVDLASGVIATSEYREGPLSELTILPLDASDLGPVFDNYYKNNKGLAVTPGGAILGDGSSGVNTVVAKFVAAGVDLTASLIGNLPASVTGGMKGTATVAILNEKGGDAALGTVTIQLEIATDAEGDGETLLKSLPERIDLRQQQSRTYRVAFVYPQSVTAGSYYLLADVLNGASPALMDLNTANNVTASNTAVDIAPPFISLTGSSLSAGSTFADDKKAVVIITLTNDGNVLAKGATTVDVILSADQTASDGTTIDPAKIVVGLPADKSRVYRVSFMLPTTLAAGTYYLIAVIDPTDSLGTIDQSNSAVVDPMQVVTS